MPAERHRDRPARQAEEAHGARAPVARERDARKDERQRRAGDGEARGDELQHRGPAFGREAGERVDAQRLRERRRELDDERELQDRRALQDRASGASRFSRAADQQECRTGALSAPSSGWTMCASHRAIGNHCAAAIDSRHRAMDESAPRMPVRRTGGIMKSHRIAVMPGDGIGKEVVPEGLRVLEAAARKFSHRHRMARVRLELRLLREARAHDARGLVRDALAARRDLLRRRRLAGDRARSRVAVGLADPVPPPVRSVREPAAVPPDAGHSEPARRKEAGRCRFHRRAREHRRRILVGRRPDVRGDRARDRVPGVDLLAQGRRPHPAIRVRARGRSARRST